MSTRNVRENLADHLAIQDLVHRNTNALNQRDWQAMRELWTEEGTWDTLGPDGSPVAFNGIEEVLNGMRGLVEATEMLVQTIHALVVDVQGDRATATSTTHETYRADPKLGANSPSGPGCSVVMGTYYDDIVRCKDGEWRFKRRAFRATYFDLTVPTGLVAARFPLARRP